jgi:DMSO/TMAO reductase YedYZ molybdopterin-dependent catalytic subunit
MKQWRISGGLLVVCLICPVLSAMAQDGKPAQAALVLSGDVDPALQFTLDDIAAMPRTTLHIVEKGEENIYSGTLLIELLKQAGVVTWDRERRTHLAKYVLVEAADGYRALFALAELDSGLTHGEVLLADSLDGQPLPPGQGPLRIVAPADKRHARWIRQVRTIKIETAD